jgi:hypothetical protein
MIGDCGYCGHSIAYHMPLMGCIKCECDEFTAWIDGLAQRWRTMR